MKIGDRVKCIIAEDRFINGEHIDSGLPVAHKDSEGEIITIDDFIGENYFCVRWDSGVDWWMSRLEIEVIYVL